MLMLQKGINWNDFQIHLKRGSCCIKETYYPDPKPGFENCDIDATTARTRWIVDKEIPIFKGEGRGYILPENLNDVTREDFIKAINTAYSMLTFGSIANKIGKVGEYFGAAAVYKFFAQADKVSNEVLAELLSGGNTP